MPVVDVVKNSIMLVWEHPKSIVPYLVFQLILVTSLIPFLLLVITPGFLANIHVPGASLELIGSLAISFIIYFLLYFFLFPLLMGTYVNFALQKIRGATLSLGTAFNDAKARYWSLLFGNFLVDLISGVVVGILAFAFLFWIFSTAASTPGLAAMFLHNSTAVSGTTTPSAAQGLALLSIIVEIIIMLLIIVVLSFLINIFLYEWAPALIMEKIGGAAAVGRSIEIGKTYFIQIAAVIILVGLAVLVVSFIAGILSAVISLIFLFINPAVGEIIRVIISTILTAFAGPLAIFSSVFFYNDYVKGSKKAKSS